MKNTKQQAPAAQVPAERQALKTQAVPQVGDIYTDQKIAPERLGGPDVQQSASVESLLTPQAIYQYRQARFNPIYQLTPEVMAAQLAEWNVGTFRRFSVTMDAVENRDLVVKAATGKLKMALARRSYEIVKVEGAPEDDADHDYEALTKFYANCTATSAVDRNVRGGFNRLTHLLMDCALKRYAPFEIVWQPRGDFLTATFVHVPLWFFENRTGSLRFCGNFAWDGVPLKDGQWMVGCGEGIMEAISVGWMYKAMSLRDWLIYSESNGMNAKYARTPHQRGSVGWNALSDALQNLGIDSTVIIGLQDEIGKLDFGSSGQLPYEPLVNYIDKGIVALARGADLGTLSHGGSGEGQGASLQGDESDIVEQHYGTVVSETLNHYVDPWVVRWTRGADATPAAYVRLNIPKPKDVNAELAVDEKLVGWGVELGVNNALERYGRVEAGDGEKVLESHVAQMQEQEQQMQDQNPRFQSNERGLKPAQAARLTRLLLKQAERRLCKGVSRRTAPLARRVRDLVKVSDDQDFTSSLRKLVQDLPKLPTADESAKRELAAAAYVNRM